MPAEHLMLLYYLTMINGLSFYLLWLDWRYSRTQQLGVGEIPEGMFLILGFIGGAVGIWLMQSLLNHRLYRRKFSIRIKLYILMHLSLLTNPLMLGAVIA